MHECIDRIRFITERLYLLEKSIGPGYIDAKDYTDYETVHVADPHSEIADINAQRAIMDLDSTFTASSYWDGNWKNPRLDSTRGIHNSYASRNTQQWW